jgi:arginyl-tRNA synthetase
VTPGSLAHVTPGQLSDAVVAAVRDAVADGEFAVPIPVRIPTRTTAAGDYATPLPLRLAKAAEMPAAEVAALLAARLAASPGVRSARVTGPGFLTITVDTPITARIDDIDNTDDTTATYDTHEDIWPMRPLTFDNPGFRVRFAYARACGVMRHAAELGVREQDGPLEDPRERRLLGLLADFPVRREQAARQRNTRPLTRHLERIADAYHDVHEQCPALPKGDEPVAGRHRARLALARATRVVLGNGLRMLGETPDEHL